MDKIICLVGPSGSGKTTIAKELDKLGYNIIHSYTTRKPREENEWGHIFATYVDYLAETDVNIIAYKELYGEQYWATKEQYKNKGTSIYKDAEIITIFLVADETVRKCRLHARFFRKSWEELYFEEIVSEEAKKHVDERLEKDREIFKLVKTDYVIDGNRELVEVLEDVVSVVEGK